MPYKAHQEALPGHQKTRDALELVKKRHGEMSPPVDSFTPLYDVHAWWLEHGEKEEWMNEALSGETLPIPVALVEKVTPLLARAVAQGLKKQEEMAALEKVLEEEKNFKRFCSLCEEDLAPEKMEAQAEKWKVDSTLLGFLILQTRMALAGLYRKSRGEEIISSAVESKICPVCGAQADISLVHTAEGKRVLHCAFCGQLWQYARATCVACGAEKPKNLEMHYVEGGKQEWAEVCNTCRHYILGADCRELSLALPEAHILGIGLMHLDYLMQEKDFIPLGE